MWRVAGVDGQRVTAGAEALEVGLVGILARAPVAVGLADQSLELAEPNTHEVNRSDELRWGWLDAAALQQADDDQHDDDEQQQVNEPAGDGEEHKAQ